MDTDDTTPGLPSSTAADAPPAPKDDTTEKTGGRGSKRGRDRAADADDVASAAEVTQGEPTQPQAVCPHTGLVLDEYGLPVSGPARVKWLHERGIDDPALIANETENDHG